MLLQFLASDCDLHCNNQNLHYESYTRTSHEVSYDCSGWSIDSHQFLICVNVCIIFHSGIRQKNYREYQYSNCYSLKDVSGIPIVIGIHWIIWRLCCTYYIYLHLTAVNPQPRSVKFCNGTWAYVRDRALHITYDTCSCMLLELMRPFTTRHICGESNASCFTFHSSVLVTLL